MAIASLTLRNTKGTALTFTEMDNNLSNLSVANTDITAGGVTSNIGPVTGLTIANTTSVGSYLSGRTLTIEQRQGLSTLTAGGTTSAGVQAITIANTSTIGASLSSGTLSIRTLTAISSVSEDPNPTLSGNLIMGTNRLIGPLNGNVEAYLSGTAGAFNVDGSKFRLGTASPGTVNILGRGASTLTLTNEGSGTPAYVTIEGGATGNVTLSAGTGTNSNVVLITKTLNVGQYNQELIINSRGSADLVLKTHDTDLEQGNIRLTQGTNANIQLNPNGTGQVVSRGNVVAASGKFFVGDGSKLTNVSPTTLTANLNGNGQTLQNIVFDQYREKIANVGPLTGTITLNANTAPVQTAGTTGNITINTANLSNFLAGESVTLILRHNGSNRTLTSDIKFINSNKTLGGNVATTDVVTIFYDGVDYLGAVAQYRT
ncbi:hypothetical protein UFOVP640_3 [uncultured Caudovirales phage]|uniref:Uncharacterized protein n=1 Tax=uncultured Caudovirales phage TaxID=2100421 RepID=A0A6J5NDG9_9CAUD|nr:hypothetical protein UFOVP640_3 [uncultured Caudovirales phage]CAB5225869.1 hypothetical protein UFOVP759_7 [uncultured Caudovirales phage]